MDKSSQGIDLSKVIRLEIQSRAQVGIDTIQNIGWIGAALALIIIVLCASSFVATQLVDGFRVTLANGAQVTTSLDWLTAFYFTVVNMTTVGFGDIFPITTQARALAIFNAVFGLLAFAGLVSILMFAFSPSSATGTLGASGDDASASPNPQADGRPKPTGTPSATSTSPKYSSIVFGLMAPLDLVKRSQAELRRVEGKLELICKSLENDAPESSENAEPGAVAVKAHVDQILRSLQQLRRDIADELDAAHSSGVIRDYTEIIDQVFEAKIKRSTPVKV